MSVPLITPSVPIVFEIRMGGTMHGMSEAETRAWLMGKLSTINLNAQIQINVRRMTPEELAKMQPALT